MDLKSKIEDLLNEVAELKASNDKELEALRIKYLSKKGVVSELMNEFRTVAPEAKKEIGIRINKLKTEALEKINGLREQLLASAVTESAENLDLTRTAYPVPLGTRHPISRDPKGHAHRGLRERRTAALCRLRRPRAPRISSLIKIM